MVNFYLNSSNIIYENYIKKESPIKALNKDLNKILKNLTKMNNSLMIHNSEKFKKLLFYQVNKEDTLTVEKKGEEIRLMIEGD